MLLLWELCCYVLFSVLFLPFPLCLFSNSCVMIWDFLLWCLCRVLPALCAVWCRGQWSVAQYTRGTACTCKGSKGAESNSEPGKRDAGEEVFTAESAHEASPAGALPHSQRERKLHRCYTSHWVHRAYPVLPTYYNSVIITCPLASLNPCDLFCGFEFEYIFNIHTVFLNWI